MVPSRAELHCLAAAVAVVVRQDVAASHQDDYWKEADEEVDLHLLVVADPYYPLAGPCDEVAP